MGRFYLDMEWTNGNLYLGDIFEVGVVSQETGNTFHSFVKIHYKLPRRIESLCSASDETLVNASSFGVVYNNLLDFLEKEQTLSFTEPVLIAHSGYYNDFPMLFVNATKHKCDITRLRGYTFLDTVILLQGNGFQKTSLKFLTAEETIHSALEDAIVLKELFDQHPYKTMVHEGFSFDQIECYVRRKVPVNIRMVYELARKCKTHTYLRLLLEQYVRENTALNGRQLSKIAYLYFRDRFTFV